MSANVSYKPTEGLSYDPSEPKYWDTAALDGEMRRAFEICHGCRMCFKYCDSFPTLFDLLDKQYDGDVSKLTHHDERRVMDACFQCKLCEVQCPYTPRDKHEFQLDFPKLVHRFHAIRAQAGESSLRDKLLADPDGTARFARLSFGLANALNKVHANRVVMEKVIGIHRDKLLPNFAQHTFSAWAEDNGKVAEQPGGEAVLFPTCYVQNNEPAIGQDAMFVLEKNGVDVHCGAGQVCCGMPAWERGDLAGLRTRAKQNLDVLEPFVAAGAKVLVINPTCSMMLRREYPELVEPEDRPRAARVAAAVRDTGEYLWSIREEPRFSSDFKSRPASVSYHAPCHLRAQAVGFKGRDLLRKIPGVSPKTVMECSGHDGTYGMKVESFEASKRLGQKAFDGMKQNEAEVWVSECPLAGIQLEQHAGKRALHPMTVLARAYRADGFPTAVDEPKEGGK